MKKKIISKVFLRKASINDEEIPSNISNHIDFNSNKPCWKNDHLREGSEEKHLENGIWTESNITSTETDLTSKKEIVEKTTTETTMSEEVMFNEIRLNIKYDFETEIQKEITYIPNLISKRTPSTGNSPLMEELKKLSNSDMVPEEYKICYKFYTYLYPSQTDVNLLLFQRHQLMNLANSMPKADRERLLSETKADSMFDRRIKMVENQSQCYIRIKHLTRKFINGLPHRSVNIYSTTYENIGRALSLLEYSMPEIMSTSVFSKPLPLATSQKWSPGGMVVRPFRRSSHADYSNISWFKRIDPSLRFPRWRQKMKMPNDADIVAETQNNDNTVEDGGLPDVFYEVEVINGELTENSTALKNSYFRPREWNKRNHLKKIKCPVSVLKNDSLFDCSNCKIMKINRCVTEGEEEFLVDEQVKLTVRYSSREDFNEFCRTLGLCMKIKDGLLA